MAVYLVTGKLGNGKSLFATSFAWRYYAKGRRVVANYPLDFTHRRGPRASRRAFVEVIPDLPTSKDLWALGRGGENESVAGVLIIDEAARWLNSRDWNASDRSNLLDFLLHSRKLGWDVVLIIQHQNMLDKQVRDGIAELHTVCRRLDRVKVLGFQLPHVHVANTYYGVNTGGNHPPKAESVWFRPQEWGKCYNTQAIFTEARNSYCTLSRWHLVDRYTTPWTARRVFALVWRCYVFAVLLLIALVSRRRLVIDSRGVPSYV